MKDILENIEKTPYKVPDGYFETFADKLKPWERKRKSRFEKLTPYLSMAAMFAIIAAAGTSLIKFMSPDDELQEYGNLYYCEMIPYTATAYYSYSEDIYEVSDDDIIEYLIYNGTTADDIESLH